MGFSLPVFCFYWKMIGVSTRRDKLPVCRMFSLWLYYNMAGAENNDRSGGRDNPAVESEWGRLAGERGGSQLVSENNSRMCSLSDVVQ